jgi:hypothetical protein
MFEVKGAGTAGTSPAFSINGSAPANSAVVDSNGRLGLGTSSPSEQLDIVNTSGVALRLQGAATDRSKWRINVTDNGSNGLFQIDDFSGGSYLTNVTITDVGRVGIGTTSPGSALEINAAAATSPFIAKINNVESARIDSSGRLLVGTSSALTAPASDGNQRNAQLSLAATTFAGTLQTNSFFNTTIIAGAYTFTKSNSTTIGNHTIVANNNSLGTLQWAGSDGTNYIRAASIKSEVDGTPGANDMPGRLVFSVTADGSASPTEALRISSNRAITVSDGGNVVLGTTTGTKIGTATTQKIGFYNATPVVQPAAVADATDAATAISQLNALLAHMRTLGLIAT